MEAAAKDLRAAAEGVVRRSFVENDSLVKYANAVSKTESYSGAVISGISK